MLKTAGAVVAGASLLGVSACAANGTAAGGPKKKILAIGAHPDDPESICGGTMARFAEEGHEVVSVYMTRGERGIEGTGLDEAAAIRSKEAEEACKVLGVRPVFLTQIDGAGEIVPERYTEMIDLIKRENPDIVITHWPIDSHRDHAICSILVLDAWRRVGGTFDLYFAEAMIGVQSKTFAPTDYVDITSVREKKKDSCMCHVSQNPEEWYLGHHTDMEHFRGLQAGCEYAEAFIRFDQSPSRTL